MLPIPEVLKQANCYISLISWNLNVPDVININVIYMIDVRGTSCKGLLLARLRNLTS